jgi:hypothetical protein
MQLVDQQPFVGEQPERFTEGVATDLQHLGQLDLGQLRAGRQGALGDAAAQDVRGPLGRAAAVQPRDIGGNRSQPRLPGCVVGLTRAHLRIIPQSGQSVKVW